MDFHCPVCKSDQVIFVLRTELLICKLCGWRWIESEEPRLVVDRFAAPVPPAGNGHSSN